MKKLFTYVLVIIIILQCVAFTGCGKEKEVVRGGELMKYWLQWYTLGDKTEELRRPDGTVPSWDWITAKEMGINLMHIYFVPQDEEGKTIGGLPDTESLSRQCELMQYEIGKTHEAGIKVIAYSTDVQVKEREILKMGYTVDQLAAVRNGTYYVDFNWDPEGTYIACINSPEWRDWCRNNVKIIAEAGFDGLQYDYGPYAALGGQCECEHCRESWANYSKEKLGKSLDFPQGTLDYSNEADREYVRWKAIQLADFFRDTISEAKKVKADFTFIMNESVMSNTFAYMCLQGVYDMTSSEYWGVDIGNESSVFMYALCEALGYDSLLGIFNSADQITPEYRHKAALSESYAVCGGVSLGFGELNRCFAEFLNLYPELYRATESKAKTAIMFSAESALFSGDGNDQAVAAGKQMAYGKIPFDYVVIEKEGAGDKLDEYDTFIIPDFKYFGDEWKPFIKNILRKGKNIVVVGENAKSYVSSFTGGKRKKVKYIDQYAGIHKTLEETSAYGLIKDDSEYFGSGELEFTVRKSGPQCDIIHAIRMGTPESACENLACFEYSPEKGKKVVNVTAYCPFIRDDNFTIDVTWSQKGGKLNVKTEDFDTYCVIKVEYE